MMKKINIGIIGYGRFGKLLVKMLAPYGEIFVMNKGAVRARGCRGLTLNNIKEMDWVIPAVPISELEKVLKKIAPRLKPGALVMDVCSVKVLPCRWLKKYLPRGTEYLGTHPMFGPDSARHGFQGLQTIICPERVSQKNLDIIKKIWRKIGVKVIITTPDKHDKEAAVSLALVHFIGRGLHATKIKPQRISSLGFERLLSVNETVSNDTWQLFFDMHKYNPYARKTREKYLKNLKLIDKNINKK